MNEKKVSGRRRKTFGRIIYVTAATLLSVFLLTGCDRERMKTRNEID